MLTNRKKEFKFLGHIIKKESLENSMHTGYTEGKKETVICEKMN